jgi:hypothetical protein
MARFSGSPRTIASVVFSVGFLACSKSDSAATADSAAVASAAVQENSTQESSPSTAGPVTITAADLDAFEKGIARETELVREASDKARNAKTAQERGEAIQAGFETNTMVAAAPATGLSVERYKAVRETLGTLLTTLDFQGKIDGPQSLDTTRADAAMKARLASDPYAAIDPAGAAELKARLSRIVPLWVSYVNLTAVGG